MLWLPGDKEREINWEIETDIYTLLYIKQITTVEHRELYSILCNDLYGKRVWKRGDMCICVTDSLCCTSESNTTLWIKYACMLSCFRPVRLFATLWTVARQAPRSMKFSGKNDEMACYALLQGIFPIQELNLCLLHWQVGCLPVEPSGKPIPLV